jgi:hypothetical protein
MIFSVPRSLPRLQNFGHSSKYCTPSSNNVADERSRSLHPDKSTISNGVFLAMRNAYQTLMNPLKRNAYNLFGPSISQWDLHQEREFLIRGVCLGVLPRYVISFLALQVWGLFGRGGQVKFVSQVLHKKLTYSGGISFSSLYSYLKSTFSPILIRLC